MAYVLGFFAADGYITVNKNSGQFWCLDIKDEKLIQGIKKTMQSEHKISIRKRHGGRYINYRIQIGSKEICDDLRRLGFVENKTKNLSMPDIPQKYFPYFVRGYFDGDGNVWSGLLNKKRKTPTKVISVSFTSCSKTFLESLKSNLGRYDIGGGFIIKGRGNYFRLNYSINSSLKLYNFMYNEFVSGNESLLLERKKAVFEKFMEMRS